MWSRLLTPAWNGRSIALVRLAVGVIFFTQGILKYLDPHLGVLRFARIGFPFPNAIAHFVAVGYEKLAASYYFGLIGFIRIGATLVWGTASDRLGRDQTSRAVPCGTRILVHGERRAN